MHIVSLGKTPQLGRGLTIYDKYRDAEFNGTESHPTLCRRATRIG